MSSELRELKSQQRQVRSTLDGVRQFIGRFKREKHETQIDTRLEILDEAMQKFYLLRRKIEVLTEEADEKELMDSKANPEELKARLFSLGEKRQIEFSAIIQQAEDNYCELKSGLQLLRPKCDPGTSTGSSIATTQPCSSALSTVKLPEIKLPSFGGKIRDWVTFRDLFRSLIHRNKQLTDIDKFSYLRYSLVGEALQEIGTIEITAANYAIAWELLQKRYENKKLIVKSHIDALFAVEPLKRENYEGLCHLISEYDRNLQMLDKIGEDTSKWSTILVHMMCARLDTSTLRNWETHHSSTQVPTYAQLLDFLRNQCAILQSIAPAKSAQIEIKKPKFTVSHPQTSASYRCPFCFEEMHSAFKCQRFIKMKIPERYEKVKRLGLCLNCLSPSHMVRACTAGVCRHCQRKHHSLLHSGGTNGGRSNAATPHYDSSGPQTQNRSQVNNTQQTQPPAQNHPTPTQATGRNTSSFPIANTNSLSQTPPPSPPTTNHTLSSNSLPATMHTSASSVLLSTAIVRVSDRYGNTQLARALLDSCSEYCFVTTRLSQKLRLTETPSFLAVAGIGGSVVKSTKKVEAMIAPRSFRISSYAENIQSYVLPKLTSELPIHPVSVQELAIPNGTVLADPEFHIPGPIDIIIGAEYYYDLLLQDKMKLSDDGLTLQKTVFGWVVSGRVTGNPADVHTSVTNSCSTLDLRELVAKFWELESCHNSSTLSVEETICEELFDKTTIRNSEGRFVVTLPKKEHILSQLGDSKAIALKRLHGMERRFAANNKLKAQYMEFIHEYLSMGHMREVNFEDDKLSYYLPHHAILKPESTTTKLRVVFDASCRSSTGVSLNDGLMAGPVVQDDLLSIIMRFRFWMFVLVADIAKMYRMVNVAEVDQSLQRILWRDSPEQLVKTYELTTVTYGTASAPYLATKCLQRLAVTGEASHPVAAKIVQKDFYVDDLLTGTDSLEDGKTLATDIIALTNSAGFTLRKWSSNNSELLSTIPFELRDDRITLDLNSSKSIVKTLGLTWIPVDDVFKFTVPRWSAEQIITKRVVLSDTARIFDPLGLIGPVTVQAKIFLQQLWKQKTDWDEVLPENSQSFWNEFRRNANALESLSVPRWIGFRRSLASVDLHGFCGASEAAYGACLYLRCEHSDGSVTVRLITSKSRVAPLEDLARKKKKQSIPRLELSSAVLLSHLYEKLCNNIQVPGNAYFWTDSMIVKCWLSSLPSRWQSFVANRVSEIQHITKVGIWNHVAGADNPADIISRGMNPAQLAYQTLWFEGPLWLRQDQLTWPKSAVVQPALDTALLEERASSSLPIQAKPSSPIFSLRSSFHALIRIVAWIRRFSFNASPRNRVCKRNRSLSSIELNEAELQLIRLAQSESFPAEIAALSKNHPISPSSKLLALNPSVMEGILRVGGRLQHAPISESRKHPMILHHQHLLTKLVMDYYHRKLFHAGQQLLISSVREKFWPMRVRDVARWTIHRCIPCFRNKPKVHEQLMAELPSIRVTPGAVFLKVGIDLCGLFYIRYPGRRGVPIKSFVCIFVCLVTKAVHMEVVADLSTQAFLAAFKRFVAIRGKPQVVMCDNATNFVRANKELEELRRHLNEQQVQDTLVNAALEDGIDFKFIPPRTPNFGGLWEAAVKSFKGHFRKTISDKTLTYDELHTVVHQVAAILNSRPLTPQQ